MRWGLITINTFFESAMDIPGVRKNYAGSVTSWKSMLHEFIDDTQSWLGRYHMRSISECVNSMMKRKSPTKIRRKLPGRKEVEDTLKINMHSMSQYSYLK